MSGSASEARLSPYEMLGGAKGVRRLADAFYDVMEADPSCRALREMHDPDLGPMREALAGFFSAWMGGPRDWMTARGGFCIMSRHAAMGITGDTAGQWLAAMRQAMAQVDVPPALAAELDAAFTRLGRAMAA
jgi:hemoglobin